MSKNKQLYAEAARILSTSAVGTDAYNNAMETVNGVKAKFENLSFSLETYQENAKNALETFEQLALSNDSNTKLDHSNMANGNVLNTFEIDENGDASFMSSSGERVKFVDYKPGFVDDGTMVSTFIQLTEAAQQEGLSGIVFDPIKYEAAIKTLFRTAGIDRVINFAYDGVKTGNLLLDSQPVQFIHQYIQGKTGKKPGDEGYDDLLEQYKKDEGLVDAFGDHLISVLRDQYHNQGMQLYNQKGTGSTPKNKNKNKNKNKVKAANFNDYVSSYGDGETYLPSRPISIPVFDESGNETGKMKRIDADKIQVTFENGQPMIQYVPDNDKLKYQASRSEIINVYVNSYGEKHRKNIEKFVDEQIELSKTSSQTSTSASTYENPELIKYEDMSDESKGYYNELVGKTDNLLLKDVTIGGDTFDDIILSFGDNKRVVEALNNEFNEYGIIFEDTTDKLSFLDTDRQLTVYNKNAPNERYSIRFDTISDDKRNTRLLIEIIKLLYERDFSGIDAIFQGALDELGKIIPLK